MSGPSELNTSDPSVHQEGWKSTDATLDPARQDYPRLAKIRERAECQRGPTITLTKADYGYLLQIIDNANKSIL